MRKDNRLAFWIVVASLTALSFYFYFSSMKTPEVPSRYAISVIVNDSIDAKWTRFQVGVEQAASEFHVNISYVPIHEFESLEQEQTLIKQEIENGAEGLVVQFVKSDENQDFLKEMTRKTSVCLIGTDVPHNEVFKDNFATILPDYEKMGEDLIDVLYQKDQEGFAHHKIGFLTGKTMDQAKQTLLSSMKAKIESYKGQAGWTIEEIKQYEYAQLEDPCDYIVALDDQSLQDASIYLAIHSSSKEQLVGIGHSDRNIKFMDYGLIQDMMIVNEYSVGYQCIRNLVRHIQNPNEPMENEQVNYVVVNKDTLFDKDNQLVLFPIGQ